MWNGPRKIERLRPWKSPGKLNGHFRQFLWHNKFVALQFRSTTILLYQYRPRPRLETERTPTGRWENTAKIAPGTLSVEPSKYRRLSNLSAALTACRPLPARAMASKTWHRHWFTS